MRENLLRYGKRTGYLGFGIALMVVLVLFTGSYALTERTGQADANFVDHLKESDLPMRSLAIFIVGTLAGLSVAFFAFTLMEIFLPPTEFLLWRSLTLVIGVSVSLQLVAISLFQFLLLTDANGLTFREGRVWIHILLRYSQALYGIVMAGLGWAFTKVSFFPHWISWVTLGLAFWQFIGNAALHTSARQDTLHGVAYAALPIWIVLISAILLMLEAKPSETTLNITGKTK